jgi:2-amino-4-hydroxy-6-hydroxymethyldihydropteridine diphosphokinase
MTDKHLVYLAAGANLGRRQHNLKQALRALPPQVEISAVSRLYETAPAYVLDQPVFLNIAVEGQTGVSPTELLAYLQQIEKSMGRERKLRHGPRLIDLDIIFYDDLALDLPQLTIPHPRMHERGFVLRPLADIAPDFVHPLLKQSVRTLLANLPAGEGVLKIIDWQPFSDG